MSRLPRTMSAILEAVLLRIFTWFLILSRLAMGAIHKYRIATRGNVGNPRLPPELVDLVLRSIDYEDRRTLYSCALVSHTWLALSRLAHFSEIMIGPPYADTLFRAFMGATIRPYVSMIHLAVNPDCEWIQTHLLKFLAQFPNLTTLFLLHTRTEILVSQLSRAIYDRPSHSRDHSFGIAIVDNAVTFVRQQIAMAEERQAKPFVVAEHPAASPLTRIRTVHLDYPGFNLRVLSLLALPTIETFHLTLRHNATIPTCLRVAGPGIRILQLYILPDFRHELPLTPFLTKLRALRVYCPPPFSAAIALAQILLKSVLSAPDLEELVIEAAFPKTLEALYNSEFEVKRRDAARAELDLVLQPLAAFKTFRMERVDLPAPKD
ncbi:hypothetical protein FB451DRAFT_1378435 [Mycena latifolia]|nr:hypothetical protein FB451DRAFT_1378435 [Mycena latifolia]